VLTTVEAIVERLVAGYAPDRIILFGSRAAGTARDDSDVDLLVVKETDRRPVERRIEVERLLADRALPIDVIVYTPEELRRLFAVGSPFVEIVRYAKTQDIDLIVLGTHGRGPIAHMLIGSVAGVVTYFIGDFLGAKIS